MHVKHLLPTATAALVLSTSISSYGSEEAITLGGSFRFNISAADWDEGAKERAGDGSYNLANITANGTKDGVTLSADYRFYGYMDVPHHAWIGYQLTDEWQGQIGITKVPFGILPYESNNFWFGIPYYVGLNDDYDIGAKFLYEKDNLDIQLAFFTNSEQRGSDAKSYSIDPVTNGTDQMNEESNQINARFAYTVNHSKTSSSEFGLSTEWGQLYNGTTEDNGDHWAIGFHLNGFYGPWNLQLEAITYEYNPENPDGVDDSTILMGAFDGTYLVAAEAHLLVANLSYGYPVEIGPIKKLIFYHDYSQLLKKEGDFEDSVIRTLGMAISAGPVWANIDFISAENTPWLNGQNNPFAQGSDDEGASTLFNINVGYYF